MANRRRRDRLEDVLLDLGDDRDEAMLIDELDGFLAGVIVCPDMIGPSRWMPHIWSESGADEHAPVFGSMDRAQRVTALIMDRYNSIARSLMPGHPLYEPAFVVDERNGDVLWELWAEGFRRAMALAPASWLAIVESGDRDAIEALFGLRSLVAIASGDSTVPKPEQERLTAEAPDLIAGWVESLSYWRLARHRVAPSRASAVSASVGRNDPCPCGSGKKYKKCHGAG